MGRNAVATRLSTAQQALAASCTRLAWKEGLRLGRRLALDRDDAVSAAMLAVVHAAGSFDPARGFAFTTYATRAIRCQLLAERKHSRRQCRDVRRGHPRGPGQDVVDGRVKGPPDALEQSCEVARLRAALPGLPRREREVLTRRFEGGETLAAIGEDLGLGRERVRQLEASALARLAKKLGAGEA